MRECFVATPAPQTTYDVAIRDVSVLKRFDWSAMVIDEGHSLKGKPIHLCFDVQLCVILKLVLDWVVSHGCR